MRIVAAGSDNPAQGSYSFLQAAIELTGKVPNILSIPTARYTEGGHGRAVEPLRKHVSSLGLPFRVLHDFGQMPSLSETAELLAWADLIWVSGGNTRYMIQQWQLHHVDPLIAQAIISGDVVGAGASAGMLAWFGAGLSDAEEYELPEGSPWKYVMVPGLGVLSVRGRPSAVGCPHFNRNHPQTAVPRAAAFCDQLLWQPQGTVGIGVEDASALQVVGDEVSALGYVPTSRIHRIAVGSSLTATTLHPSDGAMPFATYLSA